MNDIFHILSNRIISDSNIFQSRRAVRIAAAAIITMLIITQTGCSSESGNATAGSEPVTSENYYLDTVCTIAVYGLTDDTGKTVPASDAEDSANAAIDKAWQRCAELDKMLSRTQEASEISRINKAGGEWTEVSDETASLIADGIRYSELSGGDFDITIGGVSDLWDFHADTEDARVPDAEVLAAAVNHVDYNNVEIDGSRVRITDPDARIDLGGIAKGYIGDRMTEVLEGEGVTSAIINLGGNVICIGAKDNSAAGSIEDAEASEGSNDTENNDSAGDGDFVIGVEAPYSDRSEIVGKIRARDMSLVTSGVYERYIEVGGKKYHHILSTRTGYSVETDLDAVTLAGDTGHSMDLDALSTICLIQGHEAAEKLIESTDGVEAVFILHDGTIDQTTGMKFE